MQCVKHQLIRDKYIVQIHDIIRSQPFNMVMLLWSDTWNIAHHKQIELKNITGQYIDQVLKNRIGYVPFFA